MASSAADAWKLMFDFLMKSAPQRLESQQKHGLTPNDSRALFSLDKAGKPVGTLAREWGCDPSTATWLVDRLERAGLAERVPSPDDRRVKLVRVTRRGTETLQDLMAAYQRPPAEMSRLSRDELAALVGILGKLRKDA
ncbi:MULTISPECIES: MarR family winged helix-turn-helix transcriptional regulator [unclassified Pigmentiphaga]|uniref:MarR family winged helix-turn-helix transcriptional regulator n=1 Tax=unclassified Pigmentiphaga TaxID=2626614 RepID=UPI000B40DD89|nr:MULTISPECIES: MarR family transcriptional regulator [unclassified Pigmentiphaga]OVZ62372.1 MarR family transcriptional regulator [Pigmentiphaga sp. NML030171]